MYKISLANGCQTVHLHSIISRSLTTLWCHPVDVLARVLNVACFAVNTVLCIDLQPLGVPIVCVDVLVNTCSSVNIHITTSISVLFLKQYAIKSTCTVANMSCNACSFSYSKITLSISRHFSRLTQESDNR